MPPDTARDSMMCTTTAVLPQPASRLPGCSNNAVPTACLSSPEDPASQPATLLQCSAHATAAHQQPATEEQQHWALILQQFGKTCRLLCHPMAHFKQLFSWDCGLACAVMAIRAVGAHHQHCDYNILRQLCPTTSIWTIDLAHLLRHFGLDVSFFTVTLGPNPAFYNESFYLAHMQDDERRVSELFRSAHAAGIRLQQRSVCWQELAGQLVQGDVLVLLLIDKRKLDPWLLAADLCLPYALCRMDLGYAGHYILLVGWDAATNHFLVRDPSMDGHVEMRVSPGVLDAARRAFGTDEDVLVVQHPGLQQTVVLLPNEQPAPAATSAANDEDDAPIVLLAEAKDIHSEASTPEATASPAAAGGIVEGALVQQQPAAQQGALWEPGSATSGARDSISNGSIPVEASTQPLAATALCPTAITSDATASEQLQCAASQRKDATLLSQRQQQEHEAVQARQQQNHAGVTEQGMGMSGQALAQHDAAASAAMSSAATVNVQPSWTWYWWMMGGYGSSHAAQLQRMSLQQRQELMAAQQQQQQQYAPMQLSPGAAVPNVEQHEQPGCGHHALCISESVPSPQQTALQISGDGCSQTACLAAAQHAAALAAAVPWVPTHSQQEGEDASQQPQQLSHKATAFDWVSWGRHQHHGHQRPISPQDGMSGTDGPPEGSKAKKPRQRSAQQHMQHSTMQQQQQQSALSMQLSAQLQQQHVADTTQQQAHAGSPGTSWSLFWSWTPSAGTWSAAWTSGANTNTSSGSSSSTTATASTHAHSGSDCNSNGNSNGSGMVSLAALFYGSSCSHSKPAKTKAVASRCNDATMCAASNGMPLEDGVMQTDLAQAQQQQKLLLA